MQKITFLLFRKSSQATTRWRLFDGLAKTVKTMNLIMRSVFKRWLGWCLLGLVASASLPAWSQGAGFVCDTVFRQVRSSGTQYLLLQFPTVGTAPVASSPTTAALRSVPNSAGGNSGLNAIGWSPIDNYIYGLAIGGGAGDRPRLFRIGQTGEVFNGTVAVPMAAPRLKPIWE